MRFHSTACLLAFVVLPVLSLSARPVDAAQQTARTRTRLSLGWKFHRGDAGGNAADPSFDDGGWESVCVPHSASYDAPTPVDELKFYEGVVWYRRSFDLPDGTDQKVLLEFEGAMQVAEVWVNGEKVGMHDNSGYTGFSFDITAQAKPGEENLLAVRLDNHRTVDIPPGVVAPDYLIFSGLYRDVWLVVAKSVYVPFCGLRVSTPTASSAEAVVKVETLVKNDGQTSRNCTVDIDILDTDDEVVTSMSESQEIGAGGDHTFEQLSESISSPHLWSPDDCYLYTAVVTVRDGDDVLDRLSTRLGIRSIQWTNNNGFILNGERLQLRGTNLHQAFAWVENASPDSRLRADVALIKDMGCNAVRCSHYPRDPAFYEACDELGILLMVEVPTYGAGTTSFNSAFWDRLKKCGQEMVTQAYNHPSIILWGLFNEAWADFPSGIGAVNAAVTALDNTRPTAVATVSQSFSHLNIPGVVGLNYGTGAGNGAWKIVNTEYNPGWTGETCLRGAGCETTFANKRWSYWKAVEGGGPRLAGGFMWVFNDYNTWYKNLNGVGMGIVDHYRIPKKAYYLFRENWTGEASDAAVGGTPTRVELTADVTPLQANGSDITVVLATLRDGGGRCIDTERGVSFSVDGPVTVFDGLQRSTIDGRIGIVVKATTDPGTVVVRVSSSGLEGDEIEIPVTPFSEQEVAVAAPAFSVSPAGFAPAELRVRCLATGPVISYNLATPPENMHYVISLHDARGRTVYRGVGSHSGVLRIGSKAMQVYLLKVVAARK